MDIKKSTQCQLTSNDSAIIYFSPRNVILNTEIFKTQNKNKCPKNY